MLRGPSGKGIVMSIGPNLEKCLTYVNCQTTPPAQHSFHQAHTQARPSVTLSRQTGCNTMVIASKLAEFLQARDPSPCGWTVFDKNLVEKILEEHSLPKRIAAFMPEGRVPAIQDMLEELLGLHPSATTLLRETIETVLHLATLGNVILVGRGAAVITHPLSNVFHVRLVAPLEQRAEKVMKQRQITREEALEFIKKEDRGYKLYLKDCFKADSEDHMLYDLVVNSARIPPDNVACVIGEAVMSWARTQPLLLHSRDASQAQGQPPVFL
jgi:cytidylate kinase